MSEAKQAIWKIVIGLASGWCLLATILPVHAQAPKAQVPKIPVAPPTLPLPNSQVDKNELSESEPSTPAVRMPRDFSDLPKRISNADAGKPPILPPSPISAAGPQTPNAAPAPLPIQYRGSSLPPSFVPINNRRSKQAELPREINTPIHVPPKKTIDAQAPRIIPTQPQLGNSKTLPQIIVRKNGPKTGKVGQILEYAVVVQNASGETAKNLIIEDWLPEDAELVSSNPAGQIRDRKIIWSVPSLAPQGLLRFTVRMRNNSTGRFAMKTAASLRYETVTQTEVSGSPVIVDVRGPGSLTIGQKGLFQIAVHNKSRKQLEGMLVSTQLPTGLKHPAGKDIEAVVKSLAPGAKIDITLELQASQAGIFPVDFRVLSPDGKQELSGTRREVTIGSAPKVTLKKTGPPVLTVGQVTEYVLEVVNQGTAAATDVEVLDRLPEGLTFVEASNRGKFEPVTSTVRFTIGAVLPGQTVKVGLRVKGNRAGECVNPVRAQMEGGIQVGLTANLVIQDGTALPRQLEPQGRE